MTTEPKDNDPTLAEELLPLVARKNMTQNPAEHIGASLFYDVAPGWETDPVRQESDVETVRTPREMERAFADPDVKTLFIPSGAAITRQVACRICERSGPGKTVFYESRRGEDADSKGT